MTINRVFLSGNLTREPNLRRNSSGIAILDIGIAVNDRKKNPRTGEYENYPNYFDCAMFGSRAEKISGYMSKGMKVAIEGKLRFSSWERDGQRRTKVDVVIDEIEFLSQSRQSYQNGNQNSQYQQGNQYQNSGYQNTTPDVQYSDSAIYDDDIPF